MKFIAFVPFAVVPAATPLRFEKKWWKRKPLTLNYIINVTDTNNHKTIDEQTIVAVYKSDLRPKDYRTIIETLKIP